MKKQTSILVLTVASAMLIVSCSKKDSVDNVPVSNLIYGRVVELGNDQPISGAELITSTCARTDNVFGCVEWAKISDFTAPNGTFFVRRDRFRNHLLQKSGYWDYVNRPDYSSIWSIAYQPAPITYYSSSGQWDSLLIKLFPINNITIRVRNSGVQTVAILQCRATLSGTNGHNIFLRAGIDSSFHYPVFGNGENKIFIRRDYPLSDTVSIQTRYIAKNEILSLDISY